MDSHCRDNKDSFKMPDIPSTLIGILLDVSGSMKSSVGEGVNEKGGEWVRSIFQVIDDLIKHDVTKNNAVFAVGFGTRINGKEIFDILSTLNLYQNTASSYLQHLPFEETINCILDILQNAGASSVRLWARVDIIKKVVSQNMATVVLDELKSSRDFRNAFVYDFLPPVCRNFTYENQSLLSKVLLINPVTLGATSVASVIRPANENDIKEVMTKAMPFLLRNVSIQSSIFSVQEAANIVHGCIDKEELTNERMQELMDIVRPIIYGGTPLLTSLEMATELFSIARYRNQKKLLFVLSDGMPTDYHAKPERLFWNLMPKEVVVVSCFITRTTLQEPKRLYSMPEVGWERGAQFMFALSSEVPAQLLPRTIFIKRGWKIDITNNETKLFLQVNHPDIMRDACDLARNVVCCQDALADLLVSVKLDIYINQSTTGFGAPDQEGGTCYANASAAVLHLSMKRILGREGGYPDFYDLRKNLIDLYGKEGADTLGVLQYVCPKYRLRCREVDILGAMQAITAKRLVVARFRLTDAEWAVFSKFYEEHKTGILTRNEIDLRKPRHGRKLGHAVVLTSFNSQCLYLMNSWGTDWGDMGFFRVQNADVLDLVFIDVFWTLNDLTESEKTYYAQHGSKVAIKLMKTLTSLHVAKYKCPLCSQTSLVTEFSGHLTRAKCPKCCEEFNTNEAGNILALNMYLTSISR